MAALVCDLCGGKLIMGSGGIATCDSCGMEHSADRMKEKVQEIKGIVQVDSSHLTQNYMRIAHNAYDSGNKAEAENYCNKILETVPTHQQAWLLKGRAAGWQSTLGNIRFAEAINCFANAIANTEEEENEYIINECKQEVRELAEALIRLRGERFAKWPDEEEKNGFMSDLTAILQAILQFFKTVGTLINKDELMAPLATIINNSVMNAWNNVVRPTFANDHDGHPDDYELKRLIARAEHCTDLLEQAINLSDADDAGDVQRYKNLITIHEYLINAQSYSYETVHVGYSNWDASKLYENRYVKSKSLTEEAKRQRRQLVSTYQSKIKSIESAAAAKEAAEKAKSQKEFWEKFSEERAIIDDAIVRLKQKRTDLSSAKTGFNQIKLIDTVLQKLSDILEQDRTSIQELSQDELKTISELTGIWDNLQNMEKEDAFFDKNPLLKEEPAIRSKLEADRESLRIAQKPIADLCDGSGGGILAFRIVGCVCILVITYLLGNAFWADMQAGRGSTSVNFFAILLLMAFLAGAVACIYGPIKRTIERKKNISQLLESIENGEIKLRQIEDIKKAR